MLAALCRKFIICIRLPDYAYYINGPETLPPPLSKEEEKVVFAGLEAGNPDCRDVLIVHNLRLVVYIAKKFESKTASVEDMISIGTIGLIKAVNTLDVYKRQRQLYAQRAAERTARRASQCGEPAGCDVDRLRDCLLYTSIPYTAASPFRPSLPRGRPAPEPIFQSSSPALRCPAPADSS